MNESIKHRISLIHMTIESIYKEDNCDFWQQQQQQAAYWTLITALFYKFYKNKS